MARRPLSVSIWVCHPEFGKHPDFGALHQGCISVVEQARRAAGCLDFAISADLIDPGRVNIFERWESQAAVEAFRGGGPSEAQGAVMRSASVAEYDVADVRQLFER